MKFLWDLLGSLSPAYIGFYTLIHGARKVGVDGSGNVYYSASPRKGYKRARRWVLYKTEAEASLVPPEWHGWLHYQTDAIPQSETPSFRRAWQKPHRPNLTGTSGAYLPPGHILAQGRRDRATGDYTPWTPPQ